MRMTMRMRVRHISELFRSAMLGSSQEGCPSLDLENEGPLGSS